MSPPNISEVRGSAFSFVIEILLESCAADVAVALGERDVLGAARVARLAHVAARRPGGGASSH